ncbi:hypothetical protein GCM10011578_096330 [Streptomyces fuscichromogenes]|uniref:Mutator family transposase n=1 Tax=Streptomyces fuscichromogenes TaxID=1324013 RepID=A0A917XNV1_9ACTN|nr:transposase [Streptomyces fuscichromogenes]GGN44921.1 hypothetical protein GCM10011578_096330 [Streptomyces fuscichromogenes]
MALSQSELMRLLESLRRADGVEAIRVVCERILQELIEAEATEVIGAAPREHSEARTTWRNGHRERLLTTQAGDLDLKIPKVRSGSVHSLRAAEVAADLAGHYVAGGVVAAGHPVLGWDRTPEPPAGLAAMPQPSLDRTNPVRRVIDRRMASQRNCPERKLQAQR